MIEFNKKSELLYDIAWREKESQRYRKENIENKAHYYIIINSLVFSIILSNLIVFFERLIAPLSQIILFSSLGIIGVSLIFCLFALIPLKSESFNMSKLIEKVEEDDSNEEIKHVTGNLTKYIKQREQNNDKKAKFVYISYLFCIIGYIAMFMGILLFILKV